MLVFFFHYRWDFRPSGRTGKMQLLSKQCWDAQVFQIGPADRSCANLVHLRLEQFTAAIQGSSRSTAEANIADIARVARDSNPSEAAYYVTWMSLDICMSISQLSNKLYTTEVCMTSPWSTLNSNFPRRKAVEQNRTDHHAMNGVNGLNGVKQAPTLSPTQQKAKDELVKAIKTKAAPLVELRSPPALGRGYGVTSVLKAAAVQLGVPLLGVATALSETEGQALKALHSAAYASLMEHGVAIIDDLDLACAPRSVRRSRTLIGEIKGSGDLFNWEVAPTPTMLLKALSDEASSAGGVIAFSSVEDAHLAFTKARRFRKEAVMPGAHRFTLYMITVYRCI